jgi:hypothetical protein
MRSHDEQERHMAAYRRMKGAIDTTYPKGSFVAIADDQVVGTSAIFGELERQLRAQGRDPRQVLVVEAGVNYPEQVTIFLR